MSAPLVGRPPAPPPGARHRARHRAPSPVRPHRAIPVPAVSVRRLVTGAVGVGAVLFAVLGARAAGADPAPPRASCADVVEDHRAELPAGWSIECAASFPPEWGRAAGTEHASAMSSRSARRIVVLDGQDPTYTRSSAAHEVAHAEASTWSPRVRAAFAEAVGRPTWADDGGPASPMEVYAESAVRCRGLPTHLSFPLVPCDLVEATRRAGGATTPLPVQGDAPRG